MTEERLAAWLRDVEMSPGSERFTALAAAIPEAAAELNVRSTLGMVRLAFGHTDDDAFDLLRSAVQGHDASFGSRVDDLETRVTAAGVAAATIDAGERLGAAAALAVKSEEFIGAAAPTAELAQLADSRLGSSSQSSRSSRLGVSIAELKTIKKFAAPEGQEASAESVADHSHTQLSAAVKWAKEQIELVAEHARHDISVATEETDIVWWAFSGYSELTGAAWADCDSAEEIPIVMGYELANLVRFDVPPSSAAAIVSRVAGSSASTVVSVADAVESARTSVPPPEDVPEAEIFPITLSLRECHGFDGAGGWRASVSRWGVNADEQRQVADIAVQTVRELLLLRLLDDE